MDTDKKRKELDDLYDQMRATTSPEGMKILAQIVELEIEIEAECNQ